MVTFLFLGVAAVGVMWYKAKYTLSPISGTPLAYMIKSKFSSNPEVKRLGQFFVTDTVEGGRKGSIVDAKIRV